MSVGLDPTTVDRAGPWMADATGYDWVNDRSQVVDYLNDYRNTLYNLYSELKLFNDVFHCICIQTMPYKCASLCTSQIQTFQGFTLPEDVLSVEAAWESNFPLKIRSRWRESHTGIGGGSTHRVEIVEMAERTPTERPLRSVTPLKVFAEHLDDKGLVVTLEVLDGSGLHKTLDFTLTPNAWAHMPVPVGQIISVRLPAGLRGQVTLSEDNGHELSIYRPSETVPLYRRFRIASNCPSGVVQIQGVKRFVPICFDHDIIEVGDKLVVQAAGSFFKYREGTTDTKEINRAEYDRSEMGRQLEGLVARHRGNAVQDNSAVRPRHISTTGMMPGYE